MFEAIAAAAFIIAAGPAIAQVAAVPAPAPITAPVTSNAVLRAGAPVTLRFLEEVTTKKKRARVGQRVNMEVASPVEVNGVVVVPAGTPAWAEVTSVRNKGMWGKSGHLEARALHLRVNGRQIRVAGTFDDKGVTGTGGVVASIALVPLAGFFVTGTSAVFPAGGEVAASLDEDVELAIADAKPAPLQVQPNAQPVLTAATAQ
ncbi:hypothetical protein [Altericroceibacterium xinjiangense]|uniref:hypothetical protein n=1 Tax=Altericroceibacterium xinjiangense TaxID=762261 RepID=UPI001F49A223|nr:hypothetical protein [Altericroceibacterium xinjiangense]